MEYKVFNSYEEARVAYNIPDDDIYLKITNHPNSLNKILQSGNVIHYVGEGSKRYPGCPSANQMYCRQIPLLKKISYNNYVHVFNKISENKIIHLGLYTIMSYKKKESFYGFTYFEIRIKRKDYSS
jgi:hypothetical protein